MSPLGLMAALVTVARGSAAQLDAIRSGRSHPDHSASFHTDLASAVDRLAQQRRRALGAVDAIDALIKAEAAYYVWIDDRCEGSAEVAPGTPSCF
jgi:hypothetical protein